MLDDVRRDHHGLSGVLRITSTPEYGALVVAPALAAFSRQHPRLRIQHVSSSYHADLISERFDVAIRPPAGGFQPPRGTDRLFRHFSGGGAGLLAERPIHSLTELAQAQWIAHSRLSSPLSWQVVTPQREAVLFKWRTPRRSPVTAPRHCWHSPCMAPGWRCCRRGWRSPKSTPAGCSGCCRITVSPSRASMRSTRTPAMCRRRCGRLSIFCACGWRQTVSEIIIRYHSLIYHQISSGYAGGLRLPSDASHLR